MPDDQHLLIPYYIDRHEPGLLPLAEGGCRVNTVRPEAQRPLDRVAEIVAPIADWTAETLAAGARPVSLAGDCMSAIGMAAGLQRAGLEPTLLWLDAHGDFNTPQTTPSGFLGGMPLAMLVGRGEQRVLAALGTRPLPEDRVILSDARDLDPGEAEALAGSRLRHLPRFESLLEGALPEGPIHLHFDTDIVDPREVPAMNYPAPGGPSAETVGRLFDRLAASGQVVAVSLSAWSPALDADGRSRAVCMGLLRRLLGA